MIGLFFCSHFLTYFVTFKIELCSWGTKDTVQRLFHSGPEAWSLVFCTMSDSLPSALGLPGPAVSVVPGFLGLSVFLLCWDWRTHNYPAEPVPWGLSCWSVLWLGPSCWLAQTPSTLDCIPLLSNWVRPFLESFQVILGWKIVSTHFLVGSVPLEFI